MMHISTVRRRAERRALHKALAACQKVRRNYYGGYAVFGAVDCVTAIQKLLRKGK